MNKIISAFLFLSISATAFLLPVQAKNASATKDAKLSLDAFAMLPAIKSAKVSADGKHLAFVKATSKQGGYVIEIRQTADLTKKPVVLGADRMQITGFTWLNNTKIGVYFQQKLKDGGKTYWVSKFAIVNANGKGKWLVPFKKDSKASFSLMDTLPSDKDEILINYDINHNRYPDIIRFNVNNGRTKTVMRGNSKRSSGFIADNEGVIRIASSFNPADNSIDVYARLKGDSSWELVHKNRATDRENFDFLGFSRENPNEVYVNANLGEDKTGIYLFNLKTRKYSDRLFGLDNVDAGGILTSHREEDNGKLLGFYYTTKHTERYYTDEKASKFYDSIKGLFKGKVVSISSRSDDNNAMVVKTSSSKDPGTFYLLLNQNKLEKIGQKYPLLKPEDLAKVKYITYKARDGLKIPAYVTIPHGKKPYPTVVLPHGGPWVRDQIVYDEWAQLLAYNGYLVIQPQYRGSTGYGLNHWKVGDKKWGLTMQDDLDDAAQFLVKKGLAQKDRLMMFGWSYGGYAAFAASMRENNIYQCVVAGAGVSDLNRTNSTISHPFGRASQRPTIAGVSPIEHVDKVNVPILVVHGDMDKIVPVKHSQEFVEQLEDLGKDYKYLEFKGLGHKSYMFSYDDKIKFYTELLNWLDTKCG